MGGHCGQVFSQFSRCCVSLYSTGIDGARGSLVLMSNEPMIRGGGPEAWRHLDLADEAQSKPSLLPILLPLSPFFLFSTASCSSCCARPVRHPPLRDPTHDQFTSRSPANLRSLDLGRFSFAIALPRSTNRPFARIFSSNSIRFE